MSTEDKDRRIQQQLSNLLDYNTPPVTLREAQERGERIATRATPFTPKRRVKGLVPALAWMLGLLVLGALGLGIFVGVSGTAATKPAPVAGTGKLSDHLVLDQNHVVAGHWVNGDLVVYNPGATFNLNRGCQPQIAVALNRGSFHQQISFSLMCSTAPLLIVHGTTRLPISVDTTYGQCSQSGPGTPAFPKCLANDGIPPLPEGTYLAKVEWDGPVALPTPNEVALTLGANSHTSVGPPVTTPLASCTTHDLHTVVQVTEGSAEHWVIFVRFINVSDKTCTLMGSPYITFLDAAGHQVGLPAQNGGPGTKVVLAPGASALSGVWESESELATTNGFTCSIAHAVALKVEPPGQEMAVIVKGSGYDWPQAMVMCSNLAAQADPVTLY